jgi:hypothetical protein
MQRRKETKERKERKKSCLIANEAMEWPKLQNNCTTLGLAQCKFRKRLAKHDQ